MATKTEQLLAYLQTPGLSDAAIANEINRIGISAQEVSALTGVPAATVQQRLTAATPVTTATSKKPTFATQAETGLYDYLQTPNLTDAQIAAEVIRLGLNAQQISSMTGVPVGQVQSRLSPYLPKTVVTGTGTTTTTTGTGTTTGTNNYDVFANWLKTTPNLTDTQIAAEMNRLGITTGQVGQITGMPGTDIENRFRATTPFAGATQGFAQNFNNYQSIPIGAQYNPFAVGGSGSPYAQIMGQMRPVGNPYQNVVGNLPMGGYNPGLYDQIAAANAARAAAAAAGNTAVDLSGGGTGDAAAAAAAAAASAADAAAAADASASGTAPGSDGAPGSGAAEGGLITRVFGPDPAGPDEGQVNMMRGEYVIKKSSVNKYGKGLLDMINEGKVPAKKMKSLLG
jgi:hypothetical protein